MATRYEASCDCGWTGSYSTPGRAALWLAKHTHVQPDREHRRSCRNCGWSAVYRSAAMADDGAA